jgi:rhodanese-related sulfurtransferase
MTGVNRALAGLALMLGGAAWFIGEPQGGAPGSGERQVTALDLATWIRAGRPQLAVFDVRDAAEFEEFHLPTALHVSLDTLAHLSAPRDALVVVYAADAVAAEVARGRLEEVGYQDVRVLARGVEDWLASVLNPRLSSTASAAERERFEAVSELSRYFGGLPRIVERVDSQPRGLLERTLRRGCAF